ncbi:MAG: hypothetical protein BWY83_02346 [bacterium ADurb.Bin478]|nr:MAG: hypothetical protein BWY83_02346 [bacterium ADurb.Bin478]
MLLSYRGCEELLGHAVQLWPLLAVFTFSAPSLYWPTAQPTELFSICSAYSVYSVATNFDSQVLPPSLLRS